MADEEITTPWVSMRGKDVFPWALVAVLTVACGYLVHFSLSLWGDPINLQDTLVKNQIEIEKQIVEHRVEVREQHNAFKQSVDELTYISSLTPEHKAELHLEMPDSLRKKLRGAP